MKEYNFTAKDTSGNTVKNSLKANSRYDAIAELKENGLTVISISSPASSAKEKRSGKAISGKKQRIGRFRRSRVNVSELATFCRQLSVSINSGIPIIDALQYIADDMDNLYFKNILSEVIADVHAGKHISEAISKYKDVFTPVFIALVKSAEESGGMSQVFEYLSLYLEKAVRLRQKIVSISIYPLFILVFFVLVLLVATLFILPRFEAIFSSYGSGLPLITKIIFGINRFIVHNIILLILPFVGLAVFFIMYYRTQRGRYKIDELKLKIPIFGSVIRKYTIARLCRILSIMIYGGVSIETAIEIASKVCGNKVMEGALENARTQIITGSGIAASLRNHGDFPTLMLRMIGIGESSAKLPEVLNRVADTYEDQVEGSVMIITSLFEPFVIVSFGVVILVLILAIYVPVFGIAMSVK